MSRSIPLAKAMDDALVCLYQNGERVRPSNGYPVRLLLPGFEGNMNVKWLRRLKLTAAPAMTKDETSKYTIVLKDEKAWQFVFPMEVKSLITRPAPGIALKGPGFYEISGLAWSGNGRIKQVDVSADGGKSWAPAALHGPDPAEGAGALPRAVAMERRSRRAAKPRHRRHRHGAADARAVRRRSRPARRLPLQRHRKLGDRCEGGGEQCVCLNLSRSASRLLVARRPRWRRRRSSGSRSRPPTSRRGTSASARTASAFRPAAAPPRRAKRSTSPSARPVMARKAAGKPNDALVGGVGSLAPDKVPMKTVGSFWPYATTLFDYVRRAMPFQESQSLTSDELYAVSAYILHLNGIVAANDVLDAQSLPKVRMPNRDGFIPFPRNPK